MAERHLGLLLQHLDVDCVLDVGAHYGEFANVIRGTGWSGRLISFEPQSSCRKELERQAALDPAWSVLPIALSDQEGMVRLALRAASTFTSLNEHRPESMITAVPGIKEMLDVVGYEEIQRRRLDTLLDEVPGPRPERIFLKIDTQGHDEAVITGATGVLHRIVALQLELTQDPLYHSTSNYINVIQTLDRLGFAFNATFPVVKDPRSLAMLEFDGIFVRRQVAPT
jgi:FkbM family methyltransferase